MGKEMLKGILRPAFVLSFASASQFGYAPANAQDLIDLGVGTGYAINSAGQVVLSTGIYNNGTVTALPALPSQTAPAVGAAINATGQVAGSAPTSLPNPAGGNFSFTVPVEFSSGTLTILQSPMEYVDNISSEAYATGINSSAEIVGYSISPDIGPSNIVQGYDYVGFIYTNGTLNNLPTTGSLPVENMPYGINDGGLITGAHTVQDPNNPSANIFDAYIYNYNSGASTDLGEGAGYAINAGGQVTGALDVVTIGINTDTIIGTYAFLYSSGTIINLGTLPGGKYSAGYALNSNNQVVGSSDLAGSSSDHALFYNGGINDLNALVSSTDPLKPYVTLTSAVGINDSMLIVANGVDSRTNQAHAYLFQAPQLQITPGPLDFGTQAVGGKSPPQTVVMTNVGGTAISLGTISVSANFSLAANDCGPNIAPSSQCTATVTFSPIVVGALTGSMVIPVGGAGANYQVQLSGLAPIPATISASSSTGTVGLPLTISWTSSPNSTCTAADDSLNPAFNGSIAPSGSVTLTESAAGTVHYGIHCTAPGVPEVDPVTAVVWNWPAVTATVGASPTTITAGQSTTLTWKSSNATSCTATGGGSDDNWTGAKATSGSQTVTEAVALDASLILSFVITCNSATSGLSGKATANVTENPAPTKSGGGGALDWLTLIALLGALALRQRHLFASFPGCRWTSLGFTQWWSRGESNPRP